MNSANTNGPKARQFQFRDYSYDPESGIAKLVYGFDEGEDWIETIHFPDAPQLQEPAAQTAFLKALELLHLIAGVSYYKTCVPPDIAVRRSGVSAQTADFLEKLYVRGLAEFAYLNNLDIKQNVRFADTAAQQPAAELRLPERALLAMGGGKDSLLSLEVLSANGMEFQPVCVGQSELIAETVTNSDLPLLQIGRTLAPELKAANLAGALNGHVPVTAINSAILICAAILYGYRYVVFSNEQSADEATLMDKHGQPVNHQYSKGLEFERSFRALIADSVAVNLEYFSLLRPFNELTIGRRFAQFDRHHYVFSSCNRNFHQGGDKIAGRWCGDCPKCRFTTLILAPWLSPVEISKIFGRNLLNEVLQMDGFRALCRLGLDKPFECVGTIDESRAAIKHLGQMPEWKDQAVVQKLSAGLSTMDVPDFEGLLAVRGPHCIPDGLVHYVDF